MRLGLTVDESTKLRVELNQANCQMQFYKNNITRRALIDAGYEKLAEKSLIEKFYALVMMM